MGKRTVTTPHCWYLAAGDSLEYLRAVSAFFGRPDAMPHVSGPDWFEVFPILGSKPVRDEKAIAKLASEKRAACQRRRPIGWR